MKIHLTWLFPLLTLCAQLATAGDLPDPRFSPGAINPRITQANIAETICVKGYSKTVRPPVYYTNKLKLIQIESYGYADTDPRDYEQDHLIPISLGGDPVSPLNEWPEPRIGYWNAVRKDTLEFALYKMVCAGQITLTEAQHAFASDWIVAYKHYLP